MVKTITKEKPLKKRLAESWVEQCRLRVGCPAWMWETHAPISGIPAKQWNPTTSTSFKHISVNVGRHNPEPGDCSGFGVRCPLGKDANVYNWRPVSFFLLFFPLTRDVLHS